MRQLPFTVIYKDDKGRIKKKQVRTYCAELACIEFDEQFKDKGYKSIQAGLGRCVLTTEELNRLFKKDMPDNK